MALLVYMPFHIFLVQSLSLVMGGLDTWKIAKDVGIALLTMFVFCTVYATKRATKLLNILVILTLTYLGLHLMLWAFHPDLYVPSALLGTTYNVRLLCLLIIGHGAVLLYPTKFVFSSVMKLVLGVSTGVAVLGIVQFLLPPDLLTHLGYSLERGVRPAFFIDDNPAFHRIMSTLREPNALGAYMLLPFTALWALLLNSTKTAVDRRKVVLAGLLLLHGTALLLTFSRSAWLGTLLAVGLVTWWRYRTVLLTLAKQWWPLLVALVVALGIIGFVFRDNSFVTGYITHATPEEAEDLDSNDLHWILVRDGIRGVTHEPFGHGPGTAGIVSIQNPAGGVLTENYYVQIAYEVGILGLLLFVAVHVVVYRSIRRGPGAVWRSVLLASFWGYILINMLLHIWSNEAVATQWWLLAGMALTMVTTASNKKDRHG